MSREFPARFENFHFGFPFSAPRATRSGEPAKTAGAHASGKAHADCCRTMCGFVERSKPKEEIPTGQPSGDQYQFEAYQGTLPQEEDGLERKILRSTG
jgi:hypothetical protein